MQLLRAVKNQTKTLANAVPAVPTLLEYAHYRWQRGSRPRVPSGAADEQVLAEIAREGFVVIPAYLPADVCAEGVAELDRLFVESAEHVRTQDGDLRIYGAHELSRVAATVHSDPWLQRMSNTYSGVKTVNGFTLASKVTPDLWTTPPDQGWHRDLRFRQFKAFVYLSDVTVNNGPLQVVRRSHRLRQHLLDVQRGKLPYTVNAFTNAQINRVVARDPARLRALTGAPGTLILADTSILHRGSPPRTGSRYALTNYYLEEELVLGAVANFRPVNADKLVAATRRS